MAVFKKPKWLSTKDRFGFYCVLSSIASLLGFVNPVLSAYIVSNILNNFDLSGIFASLISMGAVKGTRMYLRSTVSNNLKGNIRAPMFWLQNRIGKRLWWLEPLVASWGWVGMVLKKLTGGVSVQTSMFIATMVFDTINAVAAGLVYYFTKSYILSLLSALIIPAFAVAPWLADKALRIRRFSRLRIR